MCFIFRIFCIFLIFNLKSINTAKILAVFPLPFRDHQLIFRPLIEKLSERGHQLTVLTTDPLNFNFENVSLVDLSFVNKLKIINELNGDSVNSDKSDSDTSPAAAANTGGGSSDIVRRVFHVMRTIAEAELKSGQVQLLLQNDTKTFDVVLVDWSGPSLMNGFAYYYCAPLIGITPGGAYITAHEAIGNPNHPSIFPSILLPFSENLSLFQRIISTFFSTWYRYLYINEELPTQHDIAKDYFGLNIPTLWEIENNVDLLLINNYQALGNVRPVGPTTIYLGGIHRTVYDSQNNLHQQRNHHLSSQHEEQHVLPMSLENFISESISASQFVYINLGAMTKNFIKSGRMERLINILGKPSLDIIWNTNGIVGNTGGSGFDIVNTTARVYQSSIMPSLQEEILRHNKVQLFVTIGGQRDIEDAIHQSVPVLGVTLSNNFEHYLKQIIKYESGIVVNFDRESDLEILGKINEFFETKKYKAKMVRLNEIIHDQPQTPLERAVWWIEYVERNGGTKHLRHSYNQLSWFEYLLLDVFSALFAAIAVTLTTLVLIIIRIRAYSKSLPFEKVTRRTKRKLL